MHYSIDKDPNIDAKIEKDQEYINSKVLGLLGNHVHSILLCGGFGRGEGSVVVQNGKIHIVNDYDFTVVLKERNRLRYTKLYKKFHAPLEQLAVKLADELEIKQVDLALKPLSHFKKIKTLRIENYEVKKGNILIYGDKNPTKEMPDWDASDIPLFEGTWLFRNRGAGMLIAALYFLCDGGIPEEKKENFVIECNKAQLAMGDSILLLKGLYHHLYNERLKRIKKLDISDILAGKKIMANYREALEQKLRPDFKKFYQRDLVEWWFDISELLDIFYRYFEQHRLGLKFEDWREYADLSKPEDRIELKTLVGKAIRNRANIFSPSNVQNLLKKSRRSFSISIVPLLLFSLGKENVSEPYIKKAASLLDIPITEATKTNWLKLTKAFLNEIHPGGEVARAIKL